MTTQLNYVVEGEVTTCAMHPDVPTRLRCRECDVLICAKCAVRGQMGYICEGCADKHRQRTRNVRKFAFRKAKT